MSIVERRFVFEWLAIGCLGVALVFFGTIRHVATGIDWLAYDRLLSLHQQPLVPDIAIIEIDDASIAELGRWPWSQSVQASMLETIAKARPAAIVYDVLFAGPPSADDAIPAQALRAAPTYLPFLLSPRDSAGHRIALMPAMPLAQAAAGLGYADLEVDADGIVRGVALAEGDGHARWPSLVVPVYRAIRNGTIKLDDGRFVAHRVSNGSLAMMGDERFLVPFSPVSPRTASFSLAQVLNGGVPPEALHNKIVFIGVTASGLYARLPTPMSGKLGPVADVAMHAEVLSTLLEGRLIRPAEPRYVFAASLVPLMLLLAGFFVLSPWGSLVLTGVLCMATTAASAALLHCAGLWATPVPALTAIVIVYPLWSWRRLEMTMSRLSREVGRLRDQPHLVPEAPADLRAFSGDVLERHVALLARAAQRVTDMQRFVWDSLNSVPEPIIVSDKDGVVLLANNAARTHFARLGEAAPERRVLAEVLGNLVFVKPIDSRSDADAIVRARWPAILDPTRGEHVRLVMRGIEVRDRDERDYLLRYARCRNAQGEEIGWIASLVELTALHEAERQREEALSLLSHDMRSPQASILALVECAQERGQPEHSHELLERIERHARRALKLADDFVQLARAESQAYVLEFVDLTELIIDASDEVWPQALAKEVRVWTDITGNPHFIRADRSLMTRALANILSNAVKYSPRNTRVKVSAFVSEHMPGYVHCAIRDEGYGLSEDAKAHLFERFRRFHLPGQPAADGVGLGMVFVKTVVTRHGGDVQVESASGQGTTMTITLPVVHEAAEA